MDSTEMRFWAKAKHGKPDQCWEWTGARSSKKYGRFLFMGKNRNAHRVCWQLVYGPIPNGLHVLHHCDNPPCVNPAHLWLGTNSDNNTDMMTKGRHASLLGEWNPNAKLTAEKARFIRASKLTSSQLGEKFGVTRQAITLVRKGITWRSP